MITIFTSLCWVW